MIKPFLAAILLLSATSSAFAADWKNRLACDEGLRIDEGTGSTFQIVLYGDALRHFIASGAIDSSELNEQGEFVHALQANNRVFLAYKKNGALVTSTNISRNSESAVWWRGSPGSAEAEYKFHRCR